MSSTTTDPTHRAPRAPGAGEALSHRRVVVTGGRGFIGQHVCARLRALGARVSVLDLRGTARPERCDIRFPLPAEAVGPVDVVVHLAALPGVRRSLHNPAAYVATNVTGSANVLRLAEACGATRVVSASSSSVYGECPQPASEDQSPAPLSPYGATKAAAENATRCFRGRFEQVVLRPFTVYGPGQRDDMLLARLLAGDHLELWPFERDFTYVADLADAIVAACWRPLASDLEIFNLGSGRPVHANEVLETVAAVTGRPPLVRWGAAPRAEPRRTWADPTRAVDALRFCPGRTFLDGVAAQAAAPGAQQPPKAVA